MKIEKVLINTISFVYLFMSLSLYAFRPKNIFSTDEILYLSEPNIYYGLGVYLVQLFFNLTGESRLVIIVICFFIIRYSLMSILNIKNKKTSKCLLVILCFAIFNPYFIYHSSSYLKDSLLGCFIVLSLFLYKDKKYFYAFVFISIAIILRMPLVVIFVFMFMFYNINYIFNSNLRVLIFNIFVLTMYIVTITYIAEFGIYEFLIKNFENNRFENSLTIIGVDSSNLLYGLIVVLNPIMSFFSEFFQSTGSFLLLANSIYWLIFFICLIYICFLSKKVIIIPMFISTLILTLPQIFPETAARYNIIIPFLIFVYFFWLSKDEINE